MVRGRINTRAVGLALIALTLVLFLAQPAQRYFAQRAQINALRQQVSASEERVTKAKAELERWNDAAYVKAQARARLHFVMPGETQYIVIDPSDKNQNDIKFSGDVPLDVAWYQRVISTIQLAAWR
ncbi:MAG: septum formation initiator family protein [Actinomycetes bacterium]